VDQCEFWPAQLCPGATSSSSDFPTDGNGIILDILKQGTAPALVVNNVVYGNGGRCIAVFNYTNFWVVNNTCQKNNLDTQEPGLGSFSAMGTSSTGYSGTLNGYFVDNISDVWSANNAIPYYYSDDPAIPSTVVFDANLYNGRTDGACCNFSPQPAQNFISGDRFLADPRFVHPTAPGQYAASRPPSAATPTYSASTQCTGWIPICDISSAFAPGADHAYNAGTDPSSNKFTSGLAAGPGGHAELHLRRHQWKRALRYGSRLGCRRNSVLSKTFPDPLNRRSPARRRWTCCPGGKEHIRVRSIPCARFLPLLLGWSAGHAAISAPFRAPRGIAADGNGNFQLGVQSAEPGLLKGMRVAPNGQTKRAPELSNASLFVSLSVPGRIGLA